MDAHRLSLLACLSTVVLCGTPINARAADAPRYDSVQNMNRQVGQRWGTPEDDARPGEHFFLLAAKAVSKKDYGLAVDMYKAAASWAYKTADYNLAVMYAKGEGVPVDRPLTMAWAALAAERNDPEYIAARDAIYAELSTVEFDHANEIWRTLKKAYGDDVALSRAKWRWADVRNNQTGTHAGGVTGQVLVGGGGNGGTPHNVTPDGGATPDGLSSTAYGLLSGGSTDATIAYRQLHESNNPYDPKFEWRHSPTPAGSTIVGPLIPSADPAGAAEQANPTGTEPKHLY